MIAMIRHTVVFRLRHRHNSPAERDFLETAQRSDGAFVPLWFGKPSWKVILKSQDVTRKIRAIKVGMSLICPMSNL